MPRVSIIAAADGSALGNPGPAGAGFILVRPDGKMEEGFENLGTGTNNIAELTAIKRAAEAVPAGVPEVVIHTDSKYAIGVLTQGWKAKANQELIAATKASLKTLKKVRFVYVPGHAGVPLNERADELAREAIRSARSKPILR
jgi:ribonuclease HI